MAYNFTSDTSCFGVRRRVTPKVAAKYLDSSMRTLEDWRQSWRQAVQEGKPSLCRGPKFYRIGKRVLYDLRDLDAFIVARKAQDMDCAQSTGVDRTFTPSTAPVPPILITVVL